MVKIPWCQQQRYTQGWRSPLWNCIFFSFCLQRWWRSHGVNNNATHRVGDPLPETVFSFHFAVYVEAFIGIYLVHSIQGPPSAHLLVEYKWASKIKGVTLQVYLQTIIIIYTTFPMRNCGLNATGCSLNLIRWMKITQPFIQPQDFVSKVPGIFMLWRLKP